MSEAELTARFAALAEPADDASWDEVAKRAHELQRRRPRRVFALAAAAVLAVVLAAPAVGKLSGRIVHLFAGSEPAPTRIDKSFAELSGGTASRAVKVLTAPVSPSLDAVLWVAPTGGGGFCTRIDLVGRGGAGAACNALVPDERLGVETSIQGPGGPVLVDGQTGNPKADSLLLRFEDGESARIPLVWVSAPIEAGFFVYGVPEEHRRAGHLPTTLTLYSAGGAELDHRDVTGVTAG